MFVSPFTTSSIISRQNKFSELHCCLRQPCFSRFLQQLGKLGECVCSTHTANTSFRRNAHELQRCVGTLLAFYRGQKGPSLANSEKWFLGPLRPGPTKLEKKVENDKFSSFFVQAFGSCTFFLTFRALF